jgi:hypothetical protein
MQVVSNRVLSHPIAPFSSSRLQRAIRAASGQGVLVASQHVMPATGAGERQPPHGVQMCSCILWLHFMVADPQAARGRKLF